MNIQIEKIILWPYKKDLEPRIIDLKLGTLNVIHGASKKGKSAIIHIIDWCLGSSENTIPQGTVTDYTSCFGLILKIDDKKLFLARKNNLIENYIHYEVAEDFEIPNEINTQYKLNDFKTWLNNLLGISFAKIEERKQPRASFRDFICFNYQQQGIVADQHNLLYKTNLSDYRNRIRDIFNFAIGAENNLILQNKVLKKEAEENLEKLNERKKFLEEQKEFLLHSNVSILLKALDFGLLDSEDYNLEASTSDILKAYEKLSKKEIKDLNVDTKAQEKLYQAINFIEEELAPLYKELRNLNINKNNLIKTINLNVQQQSLQLQKKERLEISQYLRDFYLDEINDVFTAEEIENLCNKLEDIETDINLNMINAKNSKHEEQKKIIDKDIQRLSSKINKLVKDKESLISFHNGNNLLEKAYIDIILKAKNIISEYNVKNEDLETQISNLNNYISTLDIKDKRKEYLANIVAEAQKYLATFAEFKVVDTFDVNNLSVKVRKSKLSPSLYLSQTGSGANWVAFHIAMMLGFHKHFIDKNTPVFNFLIFDQPSQVYFPKSKYNIEKDIQEFDSDSEDARSVKEMFEILNKAIIDTNNKLQILILDHAGKDIWGGIEGINDVAEWSGKNALIPEEWQVEDNTKE
jgi:hypothetical protein